MVSLGSGSSVSPLYLLALSLALVVSLSPGAAAQDCTLDCALGEFFSSTLDGCVTCPQGHWCAGNSTTPTPCAAGTASAATGQSDISTCVSCGPGFYADAQGTVLCKQCPVGFDCSTRNAAPVACADGTESLAGAETCSPCPAGKACMGGNAATSCPAGTFSTGSASSCTTCPAGSQCPSTTAAGTQCPAGSYSSAGATACTTCADGSYQNNPGQTSCIACAVGTDCSNKAATPSTCSAGFYRPSGGPPLTCQTCPDGTYNDNAGGVASCQTCPAGSHCTAKSSAIACLAGTFNPLGSTTACQACPAGTYQPAGGQGSCLTCPAGRECTTTAATVCNVGEFNPSGSPVSCQTCPDGTYNDNAGGVASCQTCPAGSHCTAKTAASACLAGTFNPLGSTTACQACPAGTYQPAGGQSGCLTCPAGHECSASAATTCNIGEFNPSGSTVTCQTCPPGTYNDNAGGVASCPPCPAGSQCGGASRNAAPTPCPAGTYRAAGDDDTCLSCPAGSYSAAGASTCLACPAGNDCTSGLAVPCTSGTFNAGGSTSSCQACPAGQYANATLAPTCSPCPPGFQCSDAASAPVACPDGYYSLGGSVTSCTICPAGSQCAAKDQAPTFCGVGFYSGPGQTSCDPCPAGFQCSDRSIAPVACAAGTYSLAQETSCTQCPAGTSCSNSTAAPSACPSGTYAALNASSCTPCPCGFACPSVSSEPVPCASGYFSVEGDPTCQPCPAGRECATTCSSAANCPLGTYSIGLQTNCTACGAGDKCPDPASLPVSCPPGTFSTGMQNNCTLCPPGYQCPTTSSSLQVECPLGMYSIGGQTSCSVCPAGSYCPDRTVNNVIPCPPTSFSLGNAANCTVCPAGFSCSADGSANAACPLGSYSLAGEMACTTCPIGHRCPTNDAAPIACVAGEYQQNTGRQTCNVAVPGQACPSTTDNTLCVTCAAGTYSLGGAGATACQQCPSGSFCPSTTAATITPCPSGWYSGPNAAACTQCPAGSYCPSPSGSTVPCPVGSYSLGGQLNCTSCPPGHECPAPGNAPPQPCTAGFYSPGYGTPCQVCDAGYLCPAMSTEARPTAGLCPPGGYCPAGAVTQTLCPAGTFGNGTGATDVTFCLECPPGYQCLLGTVNPLLATNTCPAGFYCPAGTGNVPMPCDNSGPTGLATYSSTTGLSLITQCNICTAGSFCLSAATALSACPVGNYCPTGTFTPFPCPGGTYSGLTPGLQHLNQCISCPAGQYCPQGSATPTPCSPGTYNPDFDTAQPGNCRPCDAGHACPSAGMIAGSVFQCDFGHFCPNGTIYANQYPCPPGTYTDSRELMTIDECTTCPGKYFCPWGTGGPSAPPSLCPQGYFCPNGTSYGTQYPCPPGTYGNRTGLDSDSQCTTCPGGQWCAGIGETAPSGACDQGHYCPPGTSDPRQFACPHGTWTDRTDLDRVEHCYDCPPGSYCVSPASSPTQCSAGSYSPANNTERDVSAANAFPECLICTAGSYCPAGSVNPLDCGTGSHSGPGASTCLTCNAGHYCNMTTTATATMLASLRCEPGTYCPAGMAARPDFVSNPCPAGQYCVEAAPVPQNCPVGTYNPSTGRGAESECVDCPAGSYCTEGSVNITGTCAPGHYCPVRSYGPEQFPCPARFYRELSGGRSLDDCVPCQYGRFCPQGSVVGQVCPRGYYCILGVDTPEPCPPGTFGNSTMLRQVEECTDCPPGRYCDGAGLPNPRGPCDPGYYCSGRAVTSAPQGPPTGGLCPPGGYCPVGSSVPTACDPGTYNNFTGGRTQLDCSPCPPGQYCAGSNNPYPTGPCDPGYYCTGGSAVSFQHETPPGFYTPAGSSNPIACARGTVNPLPKQSECVPCRAGFQCPFQNMTTEQDCGLYSYCPEGSFAPTTCLAGTYNDFTTTAANETVCDPCPGGKWCLGGQVRGNVLAGFYCNGGCKEENPVGYTYAGNCPAGRFCPEGTGAIAASNHCPQGTYSPNIGLQNSSQCLQCDPGYYCQTTGLTAIQAPCSAGYYCVLGAGTAAPVDGTTGNVCPKGHYCPSPDPVNPPAGVSAPKVCAAGTFSNETGLDACHPCPAGFYCPAPFIEPVPCPAGSYCPLNTATATEHLCPKGSFNNRTHLSEIAQCQDCTGGMYCSQDGLTYPEGLCDAGVVCERAIIERSGAGTRSTPGAAAVPCPKGEYCPVGSQSGTPCAPGTYNDQTGMTQASECLPCVPGYACPSYGTEVGTGVPCAPGYYCEAGSATAYPLRSQPANNTGDLCPAGSYCAGANAYPIGCPAGTYQPNVGTTTCLDCPMGYFCNANATTYTDCPAGYYCPNGTRFATEYPCPNGTYSATTNLQKELDCTPCDPGRFCAGPALTAPSAGNCSAGYYCSSRSPTPTPAQGSSYGGHCVAGQYCPAGTPAPIDCTPGQYCQGDFRESPSGPCAAGHFCTSKAQLSNPSGQSYGGDCPLGHYCPTGSHTPQPCPNGTFANVTNTPDLDSCIPCTAGYYCSGTGLSAPTGECDPGFYCPPGQRVPSPAAYQCQPGRFCPARSVAQSLCAAGTYQTASGASSCLPCPAGSYCDASTPDRTEVCPAGSYCPPLTEFATQYRCPIGTFSNDTGLQAEGNCTACTPGYFCSAPGATAPDAVCSGGYYCILGSPTATPTDGAKGNLCPAGKYCPAGSVSPTDCPVGTYSPATGNDAVGDCLPCPGGKFCNDSTGQIVASSGDCAPGYTCTGSTIVPAPVGQSYGDECPAGNYCPGGESYSRPCAPGTFQPSTAQSSCLPCPVKRYCPFYNMTAALECPAGFYCGASTTTPTPCPAGTIGLTKNLELLSECSDCPAGEYCPFAGNTTSEGHCDGGHYCSGKSPVANPTTGAPYGGQCAAGEYCPPGSSAPLDCPPGRFCPTAGLAAANSICAAGYFCALGATVANPTDGTKGYICPAGSYCVAGTTTVQPCATGTYSPNAGTQSQDQCEPCTGGRYCASSGLTAPTGPCAATYFCPNSTNQTVPNPVDFTCPVGHYCPEGTIDPVPCPNGVYQPLTAQSECIGCPAGYYCRSDALGVTRICPEGYYCPANTTGPTEFPCPRGTYGNRTGLTAVHECNDCPAGKYCPNLAMTAPLGDCSAGHFCSGKSAVAAPTGTNSTGNVCPAGHYCPVGTGTPIACSPGTYNAFTGQDAAVDCLTCPPGFFCANSAIATVPTTQCSAGYVCLGGATVATPTDGTTGARCDPGQACPAGSSSQIGCAPGTYQPGAPSTTTGACLPCPAGRYCPFHNMTTAIDCPLGFYCPTGSDGPTACPDGYYGETTLREVLDDSAGPEPGCTPCGAGLYCQGVNLTGPTGQCDAGYICVARAQSPTPSSAAEALNGNVPCPTGGYCPAGSSSISPCAQGTYNPFTGKTAISDCTPCPPGFYCATSTGTGATGPCNEGYYCGGGILMTTPTPTATDSWPIAKSGQCPPGYYCPSGSAAPTPCPDGSYNDLVGPHPVTGKSVCLTCPAGRICENNATATNICPAGYYCPAGTPQAQPCPPGTHSSVPGLRNATECTLCNPGQFCLGGTATPADCSAGYLCLAGSPYPDPANPTPAVPRPAVAGPTVGSRCPPGNYCPAGTKNPIPCPDGLTRLDSGGAQVSDCGPCPAGYKCFAGTTVPLICDPGEVCPFNVTRFPCPIGHYGPKFAATNESDCLACPNGFYCNRTGMATYLDDPCPVGNYCPGPVYPVKCPAGQYRDVPGAASPSDCRACTAGNYCPIGSATQLQCPAGFLCPARASEPTPCPGGYYCPSGVSSPTPCPAGSYCPAADALAPNVCQAGTYCPDLAPEAKVCPGGFYCPTRATAPVPCPVGTYCRPGAAFWTPCPNGHYCGAQDPLAPVICPNGTYSPASVTNRSSAVSSCITCPPGFHGSHANRSYCEPCEAGHYCLAGAAGPKPMNLTTERGRRCPAGHYCPAQSDAPIPCPPGTFAREEGITKVEDCTPCPFNSYNALPGQAACFPCGRSAHSFIGATECTCNGTFRAFQPSDGSCICQPGYEFYDDNFQLSEADSTIDCQPKVYSRCVAGTFRNSDGDCVSQGSSSLCVEECASGKGTPIRSTGLCECEGVKAPEDVCNVDCLKQETTIKLEEDPEDPSKVRIVITNPKTGAQITESLSDSPRFVGKVHCSSSSVVGCRMIPISMNDRGQSALFDPEEDFIPALLQGRTGTNNNGGAATRLRALQTTTTTNSTATQAPGLEVDQPVVCLRAGEGLIWDVSGTGNYPVYVKDSLYNTNPNFDYGEFRRLAERKLNEQSNVTTFAFTFTEPGIYVFVNKASPSRQSFVSVVSADEQCPNNAKIAPVTQANLVALGLAKNDDLLLTPDYILIGALLACLVLIVLIVILFFWAMRRRGWGVSKTKGVQYRRLGQAHDFGAYASKGTTVQKRAKFRSEDGDVDMEAYRDNFWDYERQIDLEGFNVKTLYDKLEDQTLHVTSQLAEQKEHVREFFDKISKQTDQLSALLESRLGAVEMAVQYGGRSGDAGDMRTMEERKADEERRNLYMDQIPKVLARMRELWDRDEQERDAYHERQAGAFDDAEQTTEQLIRELRAAFEDPDGRDTSGLAAVLDTTSEALEQLEERRAKEAARRGLDRDDHDRAGAQLVDPSTSKPYTAERLLGTDPGAPPREIPGALKLDRDTGLLVPVGGTKLVRANGSTAPADEGDLVLHPRTGRLVPLHNHVSAHTTQASRVTTADRCGPHGEPIPFIRPPAKEHPYVDPVTGVSRPPAITLLRSLKGTLPDPLVAGSRMTDPVTSLSVPILAVTRDTVSGELLPVGGTMKHIVTGENVPIDIGEWMVDASMTGAEDRVVPVMGVAFDRETGLVVPVGALHVLGNGEEVPVIEGEMEFEPAGGKVRVVTGAQIAPGEQGRRSAKADAAGTAAPVCGGGLSATDQREVEAEAKYLRALGELQMGVAAQVRALARCTEEHERLMAEEPNRAASHVANRQMELSSMRLDLEETVATLEDDVALAQRELRDAREKNALARARRRNRLRLREQQFRRIKSGGKVAASNVQRAPNAASVLESEIAARNAAARRIGKAIEEVGEWEDKLKLQLAEALANPDDEALAEDVLATNREIEDRLDSIEATSKSEASRRAKELAKLNQKVGADVVDELTAADAEEAAREAAYVEAHRKKARAVAEVVRRIAAEEQAHRDNVAQLEAAGDTEGADAARAQHAKDMASLQAELDAALARLRSTAQHRDGQVSLAKSQAKLHRQDAKDMLHNAMGAEAEEAGRQQGQLDPELQAMLAKLVKGGALTPGAAAAAAAGGGGGGAGGQGIMGVATKPGGAAGGNEAAAAAILAAAAASSSGGGAGGEGSSSLSSSGGGAAAGGGDVPIDAAAAAAALLAANANAGLTLQEQNDLARLEAQRRMAEKLAERKARKNARGEIVDEDGEVLIDANGVVVDKSIIDRDTVDADDLAAALLAANKDAGSSLAEQIAMQRMLQKQKLADRLAERRVRRNAKGELVDANGTVVMDNQGAIADMSLVDGTGLDADAAAAALVTAHLEAGASLEDQLAIQKLQQQRRLAEKLAARKAKRDERGRVVDGDTGEVLIDESGRVQDETLRAAAGANQVDADQTAAALLAAHNDAGASLADDIALAKMKARADLAEKLAARKARKNAKGDIVDAETNEVLIDRKGNVKDRSVLDAPTADPAAAAAALLAAQNGEAAAIHEQLAMAKLQQQRRLQERLAARRAEREARERDVDGVGASAGKGNKEGAAASAEELRRQQEEDARLLAEALDEEAAADLAVAEAQQEKEVAAAKRRAERDLKHREQLLAARGAELTAEEREAEKERLAREHREELARLEQTAGADKERQRALLRDKLAARKAKKLAEQQATFAREEREAAVANSASRAEAEKAVEEAQRHEKEALTAAAEAEAEAERVRSEQLLEESRKKAVDEALRRQREELEASGQLISEEERARLQREHQQELKRITDAMDAEKARQRSEVEERLKERKAKRAREVERRQAVEKQKAVAEAEARREADRIQEERKAEEEAVQAEVEAEVEKELAARGLAADAETIAREKAEAQRVEKLGEEIARVQQSKRLSDEEREKLLELHRAELESLQGSQETERARQKQMLKDKMAAKKAARMEAIRRKKDKEAEEARARAAEEAAKAEAEATKSLEAEVVAEVDREHEEEVREIEAAQDVAATQAAAQKEREIKKKHERALARASSDEERERLLEQQKEELAGMQDSLSAERVRQKEEMRRKLEERRSKKKERAVAAAGKEELVIPESPDDDAHPAEEELAAVREAERAQAELEARQAQEKAELEARIAEEARAEEERRRAELEAKAQQAVHERRAQQQAELASMQLSDADRERILDEHKRELSQLESTLDTEKARQKAALKAKMDAKRAQRQAALQRRQEAERRREAEAAEKEIAEAKKGRAERAEAEAIAKVKESVPEERRAEAVEIVIARRHDKEIAEFKARCSAERALAAEQALKDLDLAHQEARGSLQLRHAEELERFEAESAAKIADGTADQAEVDADRADLLASHEADLSRADRDHASKRSTAENDALRELEASHAMALLDIRERHLRELSDAAAEDGTLSATDLLTRQAGLQADRDAGDLEQFRAKLARDKKERLEKLKQERERAKQEKQKAMEAELEQFEQQLAEEQAREAERAQKRMQDLERKKEALLREQEEKQRAEVAAMGDLSEDQKQAIIETHRAELGELERVLDTERERQQARLRERLEKVRERKRQKKLQETERGLRESLKEEEEKQRKEMLEIQRESQRAQQQAEDKGKRAEEEARRKRAEEEEKKAEEEEKKRRQREAEAVAVGEEAAKRGAGAGSGGAGSGSGSGSGGGGGFGDARSDAEWFEMLLRSPIMAKLKEVEAEVKELKEKGVTVAGAKDGDEGEENAPPKPAKKGKKGASEESAAAKPAAPSASYVDAKDLKWRAEGELKVVEPSELSSLSFVLYRFGLYVADQLAMHAGHGSVTLLVANKLPANPWSGNAFRNSYHYEPDSRTLFIRDKRLASPGEFVLVLMHAMAHIKAGSFADDADPAFVREFHRAIRVNCDELFFARGRGGTGGAVSQAVTGSSDPASALEKAFGRVPSEDRADLVRELVDTRVTGAAGAGDLGGLGGDALVRRLEQYGSFQMTHQLKEFLSGLEESVAKGEPAMAAGRLARDRVAMAAGAGSASAASQQARERAERSQDYLAETLEARVAELEDTGDQITGENLKQMKEISQLKASTRQLVEKLHGESKALSSLKEGSDGYKKQFAVVQDLTAQINRAKVNLRRANTLKENTQKRLAAFNEELAQAKAQLEAHKKLPADKRAAANKAAIAKLK